MMLFVFIFIFLDFCMTSTRSTTAFVRKFAGESDDEIRTF